MSKRLAAFDFDKTITSENTLVGVTKLLKPEVVPKYSKAIYEIWPDYMREIFILCQKYGVGESEIKKAVSKIPATEGIEELIITMATKLNFDIIIISDCNTIFINAWITSNGLDKYILKIFTNPVTVQKCGFLQVNYFHEQHSCNLSPVNMCKGQILEDFIESQKKSGIEYRQILYLGDGTNDFCPMVRLKETDLACAKEGFNCADLIKKALEKKSDVTVKAKICMWKTGFDVLKAICECNK